MGGLSLVEFVAADDGRLLRFFVYNLARWFATANRRNPLILTKSSPVNNSPQWVTRKKDRKATSIAGFTVRIGLLHSARTVVLRQVSFRPTVLTNISQI